MTNRTFAISWLTIFPVRALPLKRLRTVKKLCRNSNKRLLRSNPKTANIPVLFLTARAAEVDQIVSLELGADDYVQKPVSPRVLVARVKSLLRRFDRSEQTPQPPKEEKIVSPGLRIDRASYKVYVDEKETFFPRKEFELLYFLAAHPGRIYKREAL